MKNIIERPAVNGFVEIQCTAQKIISNNNVNVPAIYAELVQENIVTGQHVETTSGGTTRIYDDLTTAKLKLYIYSDSAGTLPYEAEELQVFVRFKEYRDGVLTNTSTPYPTTVNGTEEWYLGYELTFYVEYDYSISGSGVDPVHYEYVWEIVENDAYGIIV